MRIVEASGRFAPPTAMCVIRVCTRADGVRIFAIATTLDVGAVPPAPARLLTDREAALRAVAEFLRNVQDRSSEDA